MNCTSIHVLSLVLLCACTSASLTCTSHDDCQVAQCSVGNDGVSAVCCAEFGCGDHCLSQYSDNTICLEAPGSKKSSTPSISKDKFGNDVDQCWEDLLQAICATAPTTTEAPAAAPTKEAPAAALASASAPRMSYLWGCVVAVFAAVKVA